MIGFGMSIGLNPTGGKPPPPPINAPDAPILMNTLSDGNVSAVVTFKIPNDKGSPITGYTAYLRSDSNTIKQPLTVSPAGTGLLQATVGPMLLGVDYNLTVYATNKNGNGQESLATVVSAYDDSLPRDFVIESATPISNGATLVWDRPWSPSQPLTYQAWATSDGPDPDVFQDLTVTQVDANTLTADMTGINTGANWFISIQASNKYGRGGWSNDVPVAPLASGKGPYKAFPKNLITETDEYFITETAAEIVTA